MKTDYVVYIHRMYDKGKPKLGGMDYIIDYLLKLNKKILIIECPLYPWQGAEIKASIRTKEHTIVYRKIVFPTRNRWVVWSLETLFNVVISITAGTKNCAVFSVDPLTSIPAVLLRKIGYFRYHYYHCTDYSEVRFSNYFANSIYRKLLKTGISRADLVGCVSKRIYSRVLDYKYKKIMYVPNSPSFVEYDKYRVPVDRRNRNELVLTCSSIEKRFKVVETVRVFHKVREFYSGLKLKIIGGTDIDRKYYRQVTDEIEKLGETANVQFTGFIEREQNLKLVAGAYIGFAFYDGEVSFSKYADPLKIREYAALGLPCVSDTVTSASEEMAAAGAGYAVSNYDEAVELVCRLLDNTDEYKRMTENALKWADEMDKEKILKELIIENVGL